jgi:hypothetical protein
MTGASSNDDGGMRLDGAVFVRSYMGMDITMNEPPTPAEVRAAKLDEDTPDYFRFNWGGMHVMVMTMIVAGAVVEGDKAPTFPSWPPAGTPKARKDLLDEALGDPTLDAKLTAAEVIRVRDTRKTRKRLLSTHSSRPGKVPAFKFLSNEGWIVAGDECAVIATRLRAYASKITQAELDALDRAYQASQRKLLDATEQRGEVTVMGGGGLGMTLAEYKAWMAEWATFNSIAEKHGGYRVQ